MLLIVTIGNAVRFVFTMNLPNCNNKSKMLFPDKGICSLTQSLKVTGSKKGTNSNHKPTTNSLCYWLNERIASHINHQYTFLESCQMVKGNMYQVSETTRLILKVDSLKFKSKMQERSSFGKPHCPIIERDNVHSNQCTI